MLPLNAYLGHRQATAIQVPQMTTVACCAHVCIWKRLAIQPSDWVMTCKRTRRQCGHALDDAPPPLQWIFPNLVWGLKIWFLARMGGEGTPD